MPNELFNDGESSEAEKGNSAVIDDLGTRFVFKLRFEKKSAKKLLTKKPKDDVTDVYYFDNLDTLDLYALGIENLESNALDYFSSLKNLNLSSNKISFINANTLCNLVNLESIDFSYNQMNYLDEDLFAKFQNLHTLALNCNNLVKLTRKCLSNLKKLKYLHLSENSLSFEEGSCEKEAFWSLESLSDLYLNTNKFQVRRSF